AAVGCKHDNNTASCDDGVFCNGSDVCQNGECTHRNDECQPGQICNENPGVCVECNGDGDCHPGAPFCDTGSHTCEQCLNDGQCDDHNACNGAETCQGSTCRPGTTPNCNDGNGCTNDLCSPASGCYHTNNSNSCDDGNACTTGDTCSSGTCRGGTPPDCNDNNPCTADSCNAATGCTHTTTGDGQNGSCETVTDTMYCPLPPDNTCGAGTFRLIDLQNPTNGVQNDYLLNASNPGQWYYNVFYSGTPGSSFSLTIDVPWPFVTNGDNPIQVHDGTTFNGACFVPSPSLSGYLITTDAGHLSNSGKAVVLLADYKMQNLGDTQAVYVTGTVPSTGLAYITVHLDYGIKKVSSWQQNTTTLQGPDVDLNGSLDGLGDGPIFIKGGTPACTNGQDYRFDFNAGGPTIGTTIYSTNTFKKNPGVNGMITKTTGDPKSNVRVEFYGPNNKLISALNTDADGFFMFSYKHTGKAANYTIKVPSLGLQKVVTLKANGYALANFENVP
ncbi:MAG TPA: hypothetical protein VGS03_10445, partial [Candidatus Polarisedimenticolia bacterium]|nr:hypothetical protein [Candidatus Polarisedimenticolia bacterium]